MSQQSLNAPGGGPDENAPDDETLTGGQTFASVQGTDDLLDEIDSVLESVTDHDARVTDIAPSPLPGPSGNREYFLRVRPGRTHDQSDRLDQADIPAHLDEMMRGES